MKSLTETIAQIQPLDADAMNAARARQDQLTKPQASLGRLEVLSIQLAGVTARPRHACAASDLVSNLHDRSRR